MVLTSWKRVLSGVAVTAATVLGGAAQADPPTRIKVIAQEGPGGQPNVVVIREEVETETGEARAGEYWLGLELGELPALVQEQLGLKQGLVIESIVPDSPAAKAGLKQHDILTKAGDKPLAEPDDLLKVVAAGKEIELAVVRGGKEMTIKAAPVKRPQEARREVRLFERAIPPGAGREEFERLQKALDELRSKVGNEPVRGWFAHPGVVVGDFLKKVEFPKNLTVRITKEGDTPAKVYVKRDDQEWEVTADKLSELPEDVRIHVQPMVGGGMGAIRMALTAPAISMQAIPGVQAVPGVPVPAVPVPAVPVPGPKPTTARLHSAYRVEPLPGQLAEKLEELTDEVKELRKEVNELRGKK